VSVSCWQSKWWPSMEPAVFVSFFLFLPFYFISYRLRWHIFCIYKMFDPIIFVEYFLYSLLHIHHRGLTDYLLSSCYFHPMRSHRNEFYTPCWSSSEFCLLWLFLTSPCREFRSIKDVFASEGVRQLVFSVCYLKQWLMASHVLTKDLCLLKPQTEKVNLSKRPWTVKIKYHYLMTPTQL